MFTMVIDHSAGRETSAGQSHNAAAVAGHELSRERVAAMPVTVNGVTISRRTIAAEVQNCSAANPGEGWRAAARGLVVRELLLQEARRLGIAADPQADAQGRVETADDALVRALIAQEVRTPQADEATLRRFYDNNRDRFRSRPLWEADHILIAARRDDASAFAAARDKAGALASTLANAPERFADLAREWSDCSSREVGGSLGQIGPGDTTAEFERALAGLVPGQISAPVETRYGVHLIRLVRKVSGRQLPFEVVRERIARYLDDHVLRQASAQYVAVLVGRATITGVALDGAATPLVQ